MNPIFFLLLIAFTSSPLLAEDLYDTKQEACDACVTWWKKGGDFYVSEGEGYNLITRKISLRHCFIDQEDKMMLGQELTKLKSGKTYTDKELPAIGIGIAIPETKKIFKFKESINMEEKSPNYPKVL
jgi:hypothetical protein